MSTEGRGFVVSESLKNFSLPSAQEEPSITKGVDNDCFASTTQTPSHIPPNVMSTSAATILRAKKLTCATEHAM